MRIFIAEEGERRGLRGFLNAGFVIADIVEPTVTRENLALYPELEDELRVPNFIVYVLRKPVRLG